MKKNTLLASLIITPLLVLVGCSLVSKKDARTALDAAKTVCVIQHAVEAPAIIASACAIEEAALPEIEKIVSAHRESVGAHACSSSSAAPSSSVARPVASAERK